MGFNNNYLFCNNLYIFFDSLKIGNFYGDILGFITALGLAIGAVTIRAAKTKKFSTGSCSWQINRSYFCPIFYRKLCFSRKGFAYNTFNVCYVCRHTFCFGYYSP